MPTPDVMNGSTNGHGPATKSTRDLASESGYVPPQTESDRKPAAERENAFNFTAWLLEGMTGVIEEVRHNDLGLSEDFWVHADAARSETLLAMRAALDSLIEATTKAEREEQDRAERVERRGGIDIEF